MTTGKGGADDAGMTVGNGHGGDDARMTACKGRSGDEVGMAADAAVVVTM